MTVLTHEKSIEEFEKSIAQVKGGGLFTEDELMTMEGKLAKLKDIQVMAAAKAVGLVDNKVVAFSDTHTSIRLVIPLALRKGKA